MWRKRQPVHFRRWNHLCLRWEYPRCRIDQEADPTRLAGKRAQAADPEERERKKAEQQATKEQEAHHRHDLDCKTALAKLKELKKATVTIGRDELAWSGKKITAVAESLLSMGTIKTTSIRKNKRNYGGYMPTTKSKNRQSDKSDNPDKNDESCPDETASG